MTYSGGAKTAAPYGWFDPSDPMAENKPSAGYKFRPTKCINALTGEEWGASGNVHFSPNGDTYIKGEVHATSGEFNGIVKAHLFYARTKELIGITSYTINPETEPYYTYYCQPPIYTELKITLPSATTYDGMELRFFTYMPQTRVGWTVTLCYADNIYYTDINDYHYSKGFSEVILVPGIFATIKAFQGAWYLIGGEVETES